MQYLNLQGSWTDERVARIKKLQAEGFSCSQIAADIGGVTRNAVIGKLSRIGIKIGRKVANPNAAEIKAKRRRERYAERHQPEFALRGTGTREKYNRANRGARESYAEQLRGQFECIEVVDLAPDESAVAVTLLELTGQTCRWPLGDPRALDALRFCGAMPYRGCKRDYPYCHRRCKMAFQVRVSA